MTLALQEFVAHSVITCVVHTIIKKNMPGAIIQLCTKCMVMYRRLIFLVRGTLLPVKVFGLHLLCYYGF